jgi:hypothetical protein
MMLGSSNPKTFGSAAAVGVVRGQSTGLKPADGAGFNIADRFAESLNVRG